MSDIATRFEAAVDVLIGDGPVKQRLIRACSDHLDGIVANRLPEEARLLFDALQSALHAVTPVGRESPIQASVQKMSPVQASQHARTILQLHRLLQPGRRADHLKVVESAPEIESLPPQFLVGSSS